jgi:hypothetical protein
MNNQYEEHYSVTYITRRILDEIYEFNSFNLLLAFNYGVFKKGDIISIDLLLRMYDDLYKKDKGDVD